MIVTFEDIQKTLISKESCYIKVGFGSRLRLGFGDKIWQIVKPSATLRARIPESVFSMPSIFSVLS